MTNIVKYTTETVTRVEVDWKALADAVEVLVLAKLKKDLENWAEDRSMRSMLMCDAGDGLDVCCKLAAGDWSKVDKKLWEMDTAAREHVYDFIEQVAGADFFKAVRN